MAIVTLGCTHIDPERDQRCVLSKYHESKEPHVFDVDDLRGRSLPEGVSIAEWAFFDHHRKAQCHCGRRVPAQRETAFLCECGRLHPAFVVDPAQLLVRVERIEKAFTDFLKQLPDVAKGLGT